MTTGREQKGVLHFEWGSVSEEDEGEAPGSSDVDMVNHMLSRYLLYVYIVCSMVGCSGWIRSYRDGTAQTDSHRFVLSRTGARVAWGEIEETSDGSPRRWDMPIQVDKFTYPAWTEIRFARDGKYVFLPIEEPLRCLFEEEGAVDSTGKRRDFTLAVISLATREVISRECVPKEAVLEFGWIDNE